MINFNKTQIKQKKILFFSYNFFPDQSAGSIRSKLLIENIIKLDPKSKIIVLSGMPRRYGNKNFDKKFLQSFSPESKFRNLQIKRFWIPYLGERPLAILISYSFYFSQALFYSIFIKPDIIFATSAKLLTAVLATISSKFNKAKLFIDLRDTFSDNFFYFYRWKKRALLVGIFLFLENLVLNSAHSINIVSSGFNEAFKGWEEFLYRKKIPVTNFTNAINIDFKKSIQNATNNLKVKDKYYKIVYAGNIGEGQDLYSFLKILNSDKQILKKLFEEKIVLHLYGSGAQLNIINEMIIKDKIGLLEKIVFYRGLFPQEKIAEIYSKADCLMLNLGNYKSLSMVIPSKIFEYVSTPYPIIFGAKGFTFNFIDKIDGTINYDSENPKSFYMAIHNSKKKEINISKRNKFLQDFDAELVYNQYAKHILNY